VFIIGHLRGRSRREVFPIGGSNEQASNVIKRLGHSNNFRRYNQVYDQSGVTEALDTMQGGGRQPCVKVEKSIIINRDKVRVTDGVNCIDANYHKGLDNHGQHTGVMVREATKQGYAIAEEGDSINLEQPNSLTRRGRVGKGVAQTLTTSCNQATLVPDEPKLVGGIGELNFGKQFRQGNRVYDSESVAMRLTAQPVGNTGGNSYLYKVGFRIRKLTPRECFRLQGFSDTYFNRARAVNSDSQLYKQAGNSVTVNVIYEIAKRL
jgi:DNA (cytosine-5)-methyltransferase 1